MWSICYLRAAHGCALAAGSSQFDPLNSSFCWRGAWCTHAVRWPLGRGRVAIVYKSVAESLCTTQIKKGVSRSYVPLNKPCHTPVKGVKEVKDGLKRGT